MTTSRVFGFNPHGDRFDTMVATAFQDVGRVRHVRDELIAGVHSGRFDRRLANAVPGLEDLPIESCRQAAVNLIDFQFEPLVLPSMTEDQRHEYFVGLKTTTPAESVSGLGGGPLWLETAHHMCVFSALHNVIAHLGKRYDYRRVTVLHQGLRPEPRLSLVADLLAKRHRVQARFIQFNGDWFSTLAGTTTPDTVIIYLSDVPPETSRRAAPGKREPARLALSTPVDLVAEVATFPGGEILARRLKARHVVLEYPRSDRLRIRPFDPEDRTIRMPLEDWIFWPLLG